MPSMPGIKLTRTDEKVNSSESKFANTGEFKGTMKTVKIKFWNHSKHESLSLYWNWSTFEMFEDVWDRLVKIWFCRSQSYKFGRFRWCVQLQRSVHGGQFGLPISSQGCCFVFLSWAVVRERFMCIVEHFLGLQVEQYGQKFRGRKSWRHNSVPHFWLPCQCRAVLGFLWPLLKFWYWGWGLSGFHYFGQLVRAADSQIVTNEQEYLI